MRSLLCNTIIAAAAAAMVISCSKPGDGSEEHGSILAPYGATPLNVMDYTRVVDTLLYVEPEQYSMEEGGQTGAQRQGVDLHMEIMPIYAYGCNEYSGDYYAIKGYVVAHNGDLNVTNESCRVTDYEMKWVSPFMGTLGFGCELLDKDGNTVSEGDVRFHTTPEPSTTIGSTTYTKGLTFSLGFSLTLGSRQDTTGVWHPTIFPMIVPNFNSSDTSTQNLPDQTVEMNTDGITRAVSYTIRTNHSDSFNVSDIPVHARSDQRVDFSWMWFVPKGKLSSMDYGLDGVKLRFVLSPTYRFNYKSEHITGSSYTHEYYDVDVACVTPVEDRSVTIDVTGLNRTPIGTLDFANATRNFVTEVRVVSDKTDEEMAIKGNYGQYKHLNTDLCEGEYSLYYTLKNGDTGKVIGNYVIDDIVISEGSLFETSTLKARKLQ